MQWIFIYFRFDWFAINQFRKRKNEMKFFTIKAALFTWCVDIVKSEMIFALTWIYGSVIDWESSCVEAWHRSLVSSAWVMAIWKSWRRKIDGLRSDQKWQWVVGVADLLFEENCVMAIQVMTFFIWRGSKWEFQRSTNNMESNMEWWGRNFRNFNPSSIYSNFFHFT